MFTYRESGGEAKVYPNGEVIDWAREAKRAEQILTDWSRKRRQKEHDEACKSAIRRRRMMFNLQRDQWRQIRSAGGAAWLVEREEKKRRGRMRYEASRLVIDGTYRWAFVPDYGQWIILQYRESEYAKPGYGEWYQCGSDVEVDIERIGEFGAVVTHD